MPSFYKNLAAIIEANKPTMIILIVLAGLGIPAYAVFEETLGLLGASLVGFLWWLILCTVWFGPKRNFTRFGAWMFAIGLDLFLIALIHITYRGIFS